jgi:hypothetical protein
MLRLLWLLIVLSARFFRCRRDLLLENLTLHQQLAVLKKKRPLLQLCCSGQIIRGCDAVALVRMRAGIDPGPVGDSRSRRHRIRAWLGSVPPI